MPIQAPATTAVVLLTYCLDVCASLWQREGQRQRCSLLARQGFADRVKAKFLQKPLKRCTMSMVWTVVALNYSASSSACEVVGLLCLSMAHALHRSYPALFIPCIVHTLHRSYPASFIPCIVHTLHRSYPASFIPCITQLACVQPLQPVSFTPCVIHTCSSTLLPALITRVTSVLSLRARAATVRLPPC